MASSISLMVFFLTMSLWFIVLQSTVAITNKQWWAVTNYFFGSFYGNDTTFSKVIFVVILLLF